MGWVGTYTGRNLKGKERMEFAIKQEIDQKRVVDSAIVGTTVYVAMKYSTLKNAEGVYGAVILTGYKDGEFQTNAMTEFSGPYSYDCPKRILDKLSPLVGDDKSTESARKWRRACEERRTKK